MSRFSGNGIDFFPAASTRACLEFDAVALPCTRQTVRALLLKTGQAAACHISPTSNPLHVLTLLWAMTSPHVKPAPPVSSRGLRATGSEPN